jgi:hypothetical protein
MSRPCHTTDMKRKSGFDAHVQEGSRGSVDAAESHDLEVPVKRRRDDAHVT